MDVDTNLLTRFESQLVPVQLERSLISVKILGYGEISAILQIGDDLDKVYKRMPLFSRLEDAEAYRSLYREYCRILQQIGLTLPEDETAVIPGPTGVSVLYFLQRRLPAASFGNLLVRSLAKNELTAMIEAIVATLRSIWGFNDKALPDLETAVDGQLSNWAWIGDPKQLVLVDTSTPFLRKNGREQLDVELLLKSVPGFIRWAIRRLNLEDVIGRYYDRRQVLIDLVGNLYKEQRPDLIPLFIDVVNGNTAGIVEALKKEEIERYYRADKRLWTLFSGLRRADRFITTHLLRRRYEFILPGSVKR